MRQLDKLSKYPLILALVGFLFVAVYILLFSKGFTYDEPYYQSNLRILAREGFTDEFLVKLKGPAGPLYTHVHYFTQWLTGGTVVGSRLLNVLFGLLVVGLSYQSLARLRPGTQNAAFLLMAVPMSYPTMGMALTELPALLFFMLAFWAMANILTDEGPLRARDWLLGLLAVLGFSLAISGRQPYLLPLLALVMVFFGKVPAPRQNLTYGIVVASMAYPFYLFSVWGSLAPAMGGSDAMREFLSPINFILSAGYGFLTMGLLNPRFLLRPTSAFLLFYGVVLSFFLGIYFALDVQYALMTTLSRMLMPDAVFGYYATVSAAALSTLGVYFLHSLLARGFEHRQDLFHLLLSLMLLGILVSCAKVTHLFSSRYVFQGLPFLLMLAAYHLREDRWTRLLWSLGLLLGFASLASYY